MEDKGNSTTSTPNKLTLGSVLLQWVPQYFTTTTEEVIDNDKDGQRNKNEVIIIPKKSTNDTITWRVCGIVPPLTTNLIDLWQNFCHPDSFLYIVLITEQ